jgi:hypothetical protein
MSEDPAGTSPAITRRTAGAKQSTLSRTKLTLARTQRADEVFQRLHKPIKLSFDLQTAGALVLRRPFAKSRLDSRPSIRRGVLRWGSPGSTRGAQIDRWPECRPKWCGYRYWTDKVRRVPLRHERQASFSDVQCNRQWFVVGRSRERSMLCSLPY